MKHGSQLSTSYHQSGDGFIIVGVFTWHELSLFIFFLLLLIFSPHPHLKDKATKTGGVY